MPLITIREVAQIANGFTAELVLENRGNYAIAITNPFTDNEENLLEWYFEGWLNQPHLDQVIAERAKASVRTYGEELFQQVFQSDIDAYSEYKQWTKDLSQIKIQIESRTPEFHSLHWEALQDPKLPEPLAVNCLLIRKIVKPAPVKAEVKESPTINLLVVVARPQGDRDVGYRTISRPLVEAIRKSKLKVNIDLLRPGTYEALARHLTAKGNGYYHIVHFDVHGSLMEYQDLTKKRETNSITYQERFGREDIQPYEGTKAFIFLEGETKGKADPVEATELANLLTGKGIPVCILNACQSGKQLNQAEAVDNRETSFGSRLMAAGMQMVVAMGYSVTVTAAEVMMEQFYTHLFASSDFNQAIRLGRRELWNRKTRRANFNLTIDLEDWMLPVVYANQDVKLNLRDFTPQEEEAYWDSIDSKYSFPLPTYGFIGRDLDILFLEKNLIKHNILLLQGMGGTGKTTLLNYLREWWQVTNFAQDVFYFGYDEKAWTLEQIVFEIGKQVYDKYEFANFQAMNPGARAGKLAAELRSESYIIILDNLESVTGQALAIQNTLDEVERDLIKDFWGELVGGNTKVVLGSRSGEEWLEANTFRDNSYQLRGLDPQARSILAEKILERQVNNPEIIAQIREDEHFLRLMKLLAGYPLAMGVVLSNVKQQSTQEILEQLEKAEIDPGGEDKTNNIIKCIEYSYSNLSLQSQKALLCLAPFRGFLYYGFITDYAEELKKIEPFQDYKLDQLELAIQEAMNWGLLAPIYKGYPKLLTIHPVLPYFLQAKLKEKEEAMGKALKEGFSNHYQRLATAFNLSMNLKEARNSKHRITILRWEYENFYQALQNKLGKRAIIYKIWICLYTYLDLTNDRSRQLQLTGNIYDILSTYTLEQRTPEWEKDILTILANLATCYINNRDYQIAEEVSHQALELIPQLQSIEESLKQFYRASLYHQLSVVANELRQWNKAIQYSQKALEIWIEHKNLDKQAHTYDNLGNIASKQRKLNKAYQFYQKALKIKIECKDRYSQAYTYQNLGDVASNLGKWNDAKHYLQKALEIQIEYDNHYNQASTYQLLGRVTYELGDYEQAQKCFQQALEIKIKYNDRYSQADTYNYLGILAHKLKEWEQAHKYFQQALNIKLEYNDYYNQAGLYYHLSLSFQELGNLELAKNNLLQAFAIFAEFQDQHNLDILSKNLARLYQQTQDESLITDTATIVNIPAEELKKKIVQFNSENF